ncbi:MAG: extracellular solute-binding protein, partial [Chloroflexi bacterium]|nr:extracellular solute-binding protein [Chloroflexota bacterium]
RLYVAEQGAKLRKGKISRREFLRRIGLAGFGISMAGMFRWDLHRAMAARPPLREGIYQLSKEQEQWLREVGRRHYGTTVRVLSESTALSQIISDLAKQVFEPLTEITIAWEQAPLGQVLSRLAQDTVAGLPSSDVYLLDQAWVGRFADDMVDLMELMSDENSELNMPDFDFEDFVPELIPALASYGGRLIGLPFDASIFIYMYRRDIYEQLGLKPATTMAEFLENVRATDMTRNADGSEVRGYIGQWKSGHYALQCDWTAWLWSHGGSHTGRDGTVVIDDEFAVAGANYMLELGKHTPAGITTWDWGGQGDAMAQGLGANVISWAEFFPSLDAPDRSKTVGLWETADLPKEVALRPPSECSFGEVPAIGHQGGSCIALLKRTLVKEAAWIFLQWATSKPTQVAVAEAGNVPVRLSAFNAPNVLAKAKVTAGTTRHFPAVLKAIRERMGTEPRFPGWAAVSGTGGPVPTELGKMTTGAQDVITTLRNIKAAIQAAIEE